MSVKIANYFRTTIANSGGISASASSVTLTSATGLPSLGTSDYCYLTLIKLSTNQKEIVKVTSVSGAVCAVTRAQESTTAIAFDQYDLAEMWVTKAALEDLLLEEDTVAYDKAVDALAMATAAMSKANNAESVADSAVTKADAAQAKANAALPATGGTVSGNLTVSGTLTLTGSTTGIETVPTGTGSMFFGATAPAGYLILDGSEYEAIGNEERLRLHAFIVANWAAVGATNPYIVTNSDTSKKFKLPDMRGLVPVGAGVKATETFSLMGTGGEYDAVMTYDNLPPHSHAYNAIGTPTTRSGYIKNILEPGGFPLTVVTGIPTSSSMTSNGGGSTSSHNNIQPWFGVNFIIKM